MDRNRHYIIYLVHYWRFIYTALAVVDSFLKAVQYKELSSFSFSQKCLVEAGQLIVEMVVDN